MGIGTETHQVVITGDDVTECKRFIGKLSQDLEKRGADPKQAFFTILASHTIAMAGAMREVGFPEDELRSIMRQSVESGIAAVAEIDTDIN